MGARLPLALNARIRGPLQGQCQADASSCCRSLFARIELSESQPMIEVICNDRIGRKIRVKCNPDDTVGDLKKLIAAQCGTRWEKIRIQKWYNIYKDHITLDDYEIKDG